MCIRDRLAAAPAEGLTRLLSPARMQLLYSSLQVQPDGAPAALLLTEECTRLTVAVQLLPPFVWEDPLPPLPDVPAALTLQLTMQDVMAIDTSPCLLYTSGFWMPNKAWPGCNVNDPSARVLANYGASGV